jgi:hypothetical protein
VVDQLQREQVDRSAAPSAAKQQVSSHAAISGTHKSALVFRSLVDQCPSPAQAARTVRVLAGWPAQGMGRGGDDDAAELYGHVVVGGWVF